MAKRKPTPKKKGQKKPTTIAREQALLEDYKKLCSVVEFGVRKHTHAWMMNKLAKDYFYKPETVEKKLSGYER